MAKKKSKKPSKKWAKKGLSERGIEVPSSTVGNGRAVGNKAFTLTYAAWHKQRIIDAMKAKNHG